MPRTLATTCLILLPLLAPPACAAAEQPATTPSRDVDITYRMAAPNGPATEQRVRWDVADGRQRIDPPTPGLHVIIDARTHRLASIRDAERLVLEIGSSGRELAPAPATYARRGSATVAGLACTVWQAREGADPPELCFTGDGVLLRIVADGNTLAEAVRVTYAPSDPADFVVPPDYRRVVPGRPAPGAAAPQEDKP